MQNRPLRDFERGAHLHVLDWTHQTARYRLHAAGETQVKAASKAIQKAKGLPVAPALPALHAAVLGELTKLYSLGHATVRSELMHQAVGESLPIGLSSAPAPPNLRQATGAKRRCGTCAMFDHTTGVCWGYGNIGVEPDEVCDSWARDTVTTLATITSPADDRQIANDRGGLIARAHLITTDVAHHIVQAIGRARAQGITNPRALRRAGRQAGTNALTQAASHHAGGAIAAGRHAAAQRAGVLGARYTSVLDKNTCGPCAEADTGELIALDSPAWVPTPNPACLGGDRCRCIHVYQLATESNPTTVGLPPDDFPAEPRQPDRPSGVARLPVAQVGVGGS